MARRVGPVLVAVVALLVVLLPALGPPEDDSFPLSTYPMFARDRGTEAWVDTVVLRTPDGRRARLSPEVVAGTDEPIQAAAAVTRAVVAGASADLCREIGARSAGERDGRLEVVSERHDLDAPDVDEPVEVVVHATCAVPGAAP